MEKIEAYLSRIKDATLCIQKDFSDEIELNKELFYHIKKRRCFEPIPHELCEYQDIETYIRDYYEYRTHYTMKDELRTKRAKEISLTIARQVDLLQLTHLENRTRRWEYEVIKRLTECQNPILAKEYYDIICERRYDKAEILGHTKLQKLGYDFESYHKIRCVTQLSDLNTVHNIGLKRELLLFILHEVLTAILDSAYQALVRIGILKSLKNRLSPSGYIKSIYSCCIEDSTGTLTHVDSSNAGILQCCKFDPKDKYRVELQKLLEDMRIQLSIYPTSCNKKKFSAIAYILFKGKNNLGIKKQELKSYSKFKTSLAQYYSMPESSFKPKDIGLAYLDTLKYRYSILNKVIED